MKNLIYILAAGIFLCGLKAVADYRDFTITYDESDFEFEKVTYDSTEYDLIVYKDGDMYAPPGEPSIPTDGFDVLIPYGSTNITYELLDSSYTELEEEYYLWPGQLTRSLEEPFEFTPAGDTYETEGPYPEGVILEKKQGFIRGGFLCQFTVPRSNICPSQRKLDCVIISNYG